MVGAIFLVNVGQDFITAVVLKIKVNIRELAALDIKESFKNKPIC
jgi:predicted regulator of Ras-like GTPase activity (Roadblock/LC7/MglB family)